MTNKDSVEKKANIIWIISFIITGLCFLYVALFRDTNTSTAMIAEFVYLFTGIFGSAVFVQTKKPIIAKIIVITLLALFFCVAGSSESESQAVILLLAVIIPFSILLGTANSKDSEVKSAMTALMVVILIIAIIMLVCGMFSNRPTSGVSYGSDYVDESEVRQYNAGFVEYEGQADVKGANIKALIRDVMTHNRSIGSDISLLIMVESDTELPDEFFTIPDNSTVDTVNKNAQNILDTIKNGKTYKVTCQYDKRTGYVTKIAVYQTN